MTDREKIDAAKAYLAQIPKIDRLISRLTGSVQALRSSMTSQDYELREVVKSSPRNHTEELLVKIADMEAELFQQIEDLVDLKTAALRMIRQLDDLDRRYVLIGRYIDGMRWDRIAEEIHHERRYTFKVHRAALLDFFAILKEDTIRQ